MPELFHNKHVTFAGGELSPEMYSRVDVAKYSTGLRTARNGFVHPQGGFSNRSGFRYVAAAKYTNKRCRLIRFEFSSSQAYILEFGDLYIRFYTNGGQVLSGGFPYEILSPYSEADLPAIKYTQSADTIYLSHPDHPPQTLVRHGDTNWTITDFAFEAGPFMAENSTSTTITQDRYTSGPYINRYYMEASAPLFDADHVGSLWKIDRVAPSQSVIRSLAGTGATSSIYINGPFNINTTGIWDASFIIEKSVDDGATWIGITQEFISHSDFNVNTNGDAAERCQIRINVLTYNSGTLQITVSCPSFPFSRNFLVTDFISSTIVLVNQLDVFHPVGANNTVLTWSEGAWSNFRGWPSAVAFYQDRLGWSSTPDQPTGTWFSQTGNYVNYGISDPLVDSDAISVNMPTRSLNTVEHLVPMNIVVALTSSSEISIGPGSSGDFSPSSIDIKPQTYHGASAVNPIFVGDQVLFVQARSTQLRSLSYQYFTNVFNGEILNLLSTHLFNGYSITDMAYAESPDSLVFAIRNDGVMLCFTYLPEQQVMAWTHWDTDGEFESCEVIPASSYDELWVVVNRDNGRFIERLAQRLPTTDTKDQFHVDCGIDYDGTATTGISGLDHLDGKQVMVLGDGNVMGPYTVVSGAITLPVAVELAHIGLPYTSDFETLNVELEDQEGTSQGRRQRAPMATIRFLNSLGGKAGPDSDHLHPVVTTDPPSLGSYRPLFSGDARRLVLGGGWTNNARVFFRQSDPLPFTITGVFPITESGDL